MDYYNRNKKQALLHQSCITASPYSQKPRLLDTRNNDNSPISNFSIQNQSANTKPDEFFQASSAINHVAVTFQNQQQPLIPHKYQQRPSWTEYPDMKVSTESRSRNDSESSTDSYTMLLGTSGIEAGDKRDRNNNLKHGFCSFSADLYSTNYPTCFARAFSSLRSFKDQKGLIQVTILVVTLGLAAAIATVFTLSIINTVIEEIHDHPFNPDSNVIETNEVFLDDIEEILIAKTSGKRNNLEKSFKSSYTKLNDNETGDRKKPILIPMAIPLSEAHNNPHSRTIEGLTPPSVKLTTRRKGNIQYDYSPTKHENAHSTLAIRTVEDFKKLLIEDPNKLELEDMAIIAPKLDTIKIEKLVDEISVSDPNAFKLVRVENIKSLKIAGPITEAWLSSILATFKNIESLTINIDELCIGATVRDRDSLEAMRLENLKHLRIENAHFCTISSWIFKWEFPQIEELTMSNSDLTKRTFLPIHAFLERSKKTLSSVTIYKSFICTECIFTDVEYQNIRNIRVMDENENPFMSD